jgi:hypothetical protein
MDRRRFLRAAGGGGAVLAATAAGAAALVERGALPGRSRLDEVLGRCGEPPDTPPATPGARVDAVLDSRARGVPVAYSVLYPPGRSPGSPERVPVCLALHGRGGDHAWPIDGLRIDRFLAAAPAPFALVTVDGGDAVNWHRRLSGDDPDRMVTDELVPALARSGLDVSRIGLLGWSLGGAGAILLAARRRLPCAALVASSPAIWTDVADAVEGAYDGPDDFAANRVDRLGGALAGIPTRVDCGDRDPFADAVVAFRASLTPAPEGGITPGCHDGAHFARQLPAQLAFLARHLG